MKRVLQCLVVALLTAGSLGAAEPVSASAAAPWTALEEELASLTRQVIERRKQVLAERADLKDLTAQLDQKRLAFSAKLGRVPAVKAIDDAHRALVKTYADRQVAFNQFRAHWTTHAKPPVGTNAAPIGEARPWPACEYCQHDFAKFVAGDPTVAAAYKNKAETMLAEMQSLRQGLTVDATTRRDAVRAAIAADPALKQDADAIALAEADLTGKLAKDEQLAALKSKVVDCQRRIEQTNAAMAKPGKSPMAGSS